MDLELFFRKKPSIPFFFGEPLAPLLKGDSGEAGIGLGTGEGSAIPLIGPKSPYLRCRTDIGDDDDEGGAFFAGRRPASSFSANRNSSKQFNRAIKFRESPSLPDAGRLVSNVEIYDRNKK